ncbi:F-box only protein 31-like [Mercenaria mercenaria]|uniref:F-box only protein 31-like n=1 Tax=Mercenaria mercenaria TaxID=6596 RepID=UPI00234E6D5E|nr:F-box only protein 31-like [Mercenaria mercenaria]
MNILDLPPELITVCFSYLKGTDLARVAQSCTLFNEISSIEKLWQDRCRKEYGLPTDTKLNVSFKKWYEKVLHENGSIVGLWRINTTCYGGLIHIWYTEEGDILAEEFYSQKDVHEKLLQKELFCVALDEEKNVQKQWLANCLVPQPCEIHVYKDTRVKDKFSVEQKERKKSAREKEQEKLMFLEDCELRGTHRELCMYKWQSYKQNQFKQSFERIDPSRFEPVAKVPIQPGLFKGMYGGHGTEIVHLYYTSDGSSGQAQKISGDPNVPSGEISIRFDIDKHMVLNKDQQEFKLLSVIEADDEETNIPYKPEKMDRQPFVIPSDIMIDNRNAVCPKYCIARFHGKGTVSPMGYRNPTLINIHFIVFSENQFGVLWMDLHSFSMFSRVEENFPALR